MKSFPWFLAAAAVVAVAYVVVKEPGPRYATASDDVEGAAQDLSEWGSKKRIEGLGSMVAGKARKRVGQLVGDAKLTEEGAEQHVVGSLKSVAGAAAKAGGKVLKSVNRRTASRRVSKPTPPPRKK